MADAQKEQPTVPPLSRLSPPPGAVKTKRRKGRGVGSGLGKTAGKGQKGQKARHPGGFSKLGFEGGQMPLQRRLPKVGFHNPFSKHVEVVNVWELTCFDAGATVDPDALRAAGLVKRRLDGVKVLGDGDLDRALTVKAHAFSKSAKEKIEKAGGTVEVLPGLEISEKKGRSFYGGARPWAHKKKAAPKKKKDDEEGGEGEEKAEAKKKGGGGEKPAKPEKQAAPKKEKKEEPEGE
jgi:large subunit ribosomal protein L15